MQSTTYKEEKVKEASTYSFIKDETSKPKSVATKNEKSKDLIGREGKLTSSSSHEDQTRAKDGIKHSTYPQPPVETEKVNINPLP